MSLQPSTITISGGAVEIDGEPIESDDDLVAVLVRNRARGHIRVEYGDKIAVAEPGQALQFIVHIRKGIQIGSVDGKQLHFDVKQSAGIYLVVVSGRNRGRNE